MSATDAQVLDNIINLKGQLSGKLTLFFKLSMVSLWPVIYLSGEISDISTNLIFL